MRTQRPLTSGIQDLGGLAEWRPRRQSPECLEWTPFPSERGHCKWDRAMIQVPGPGRQLIVSAV